MPDNFSIHDSSMDTDPGFSVDPLPTTSPCLRGLTPADLLDLPTTCSLGSPGLGEWSQSWSK